MEEIIYASISTYCYENDININLPLNTETWLVKDLQLTSVDFVAIFQMIQNQLQDKISFIPLIMPVEGEYITDLQVQQLCNFVHSPCTNNNTVAMKPDPNHYKVELINQTDLETLASHIYQPEYQTQLCDLNYQVVFILSAPRSGSTLFQQLLGTHPQIVSSEELHLMTYNTFADRHNALSKEGLSHLLNGTVRLRATLKNLTQQISAQVENMYVIDSRPVTTFYNEINAHMAESILVDKTPSYSYSKNVLDRISKCFPNAKYIHLIRHPSAVVKSIIDSKLIDIIPFAVRSGLSKGKLPELIWHLCERNIQQFLSFQNPSDVLTIKYETLLNDPKAQVDNVISYLGLTSDTSIDEYSKHSSQQFTPGFAGDLKYFLNTKIDPDRANAWKAFTSLHQISSLSIDLYNNVDE